MKVVVMMMKIMVMWNTNGQCWLYSHFRNWKLEEEEKDSKFYIKKINT